MTHDRDHQRRPRRVADTTGACRLEMLVWLSAAPSPPFLAGWAVPRWAWSARPERIGLRRPGSRGLSSRVVGSGVTVRAVVPRARLVLCLLPRPRARAGSAPTWETGPARASRNREHNVVEGATIRRVDRALPAVPDSVRRTAAKPHPPVWPTLRARDARGLIRVRRRRRCRRAFCSRVGWWRTGAQRTHRHRLRKPRVHRSGPRGHLWSFGADRGGAG